MNIVFTPSFRERLIQLLEERNRRRANMKFTRQYGLSSHPEYVARDIAAILLGSYVDQGGDIDNPSQLLVDIYGLPHMIREARDDGRALVLYWSYSPPCRTVLTPHKPSRRWDLKITITHLGMATVESYNESNGLELSWEPLPKSDIQGDFRFLNSRRELPAIRMRERCLPSEAPELEEALRKIPGLVDTTPINSYCVMVHKASLFSWSEIAPAVEEVMRKYL